jgi:hypothetical protein
MILIVRISDKWFFENLLNLFMTLSNSSWTKKSVRIIHLQSKAQWERPWISQTLPWNQLLQCLLLGQKLLRPEITISYFKSGIRSSQK